MSFTLHPHIATLPAYRPGRPAKAGPDGRAFKLSSNENPYAPLPEVVEAITAGLAAGLNRYPDAGNTRAAELLAARHGLNPEQLAFGAGSVGVLAHLVQLACLPGEQVVYPWRSFEAYPLVVQTVNAVSVQVPLDPTGRIDLDALAQAITPATRVVMVCTPNNPTGPAVGHQELADFLTSIPRDLLVIIDEAYVEYVDDPDAARGLELLDRHPGAVSLRTFSKAYGLAGLRIGWAAAADPRIAQALRSVTMPFEVSLTSQLAIEASLAAEPALLARVRTTIEERGRVVSELDRLGVQVGPSQANFVWLPLGGRTQTWFESLESAGLMTRSFAGEGLRITIADPEANDRVLEVISALIAAGA